MKFFKLPDALNRRIEARKRKKPVLGFTLVELVIVIAVLAILSGVGVLGYNGYIEYARRASDEELIAAVNTAFAAACEENGVAFGDVKSALPSYSSKCIKGMLRVSSLADASDFNDDFLTYFSGNEETPLKYFVSLKFEKGVGFTGTSAGITGVSKEGNLTKFTWTDDQGNTYEYTMRDEDIEAFNNSTFGKNMEMSSLMSEVDNVVQALKGVLGGSNIETLKGMIGGDAYLETLGVTRENYPDDEAYKRAVANAVVMQVAEASAGLTANDAINNTEAWKNLSSKSLLASLAVAYGTATAYANSDIAKDCMINGMSVKDYYDSQSKALRDLDPENASASISIIMGMMGAMQGSDKWEEYQTSEDYANDINGYFSALNSLAGNKDTLVSQGAMDKGFSDEELGDILNALFG